MKPIREMLAKFKKIKKENNSWYYSLLLCCVFTYAYINTHVNYTEMLEKGGNPNSLLRYNWYNVILYHLDTWFGKTATIIILGVLTLIPFIDVVYQYRKQRKMKQKKKIPTVERDL